MLKNYSNLLSRAKDNLKSNELSPFISNGTSSCILKTVDKNIYTGINIKTNSRLETSAEDSAIINMINNNEKEVTNMVLINELEEIMKPNTDSLLYLLSLSKNNINTEILIDENTTVLLKDLLPDWYGTYYPNK